MVIFLNPLASKMEFTRNSCKGVKNTQNHLEHLVHPDVFSETLKFIQKICESGAHVLNVLYFDHLEQLLLSIKNIKI